MCTVLNNRFKNKILMSPKMGHSEIRAMIDITVHEWDTLQHFLDINIHHCIVLILNRQNLLVQHIL